jgi:aldose 1-epimerase
MSVSCTREIFGTLPNKEEIFLYRLQNGNGITAEIISYGAIIHRLLVPDRNGEIKDIVLGQDCLEDYLKNRATCAAAFIGRVAGRIAGAQFKIGDIVYHTDITSDDFTLHSGSGNYAKRAFSGKIFGDGDRAGVTLSLRDNGEGGFPSGMDVSVTYSLDADGNLRLRYEAMPEKDTPISFTNHVYFNLAGHKSGCVKDQLLQLDADFYLKKDAKGLASGEIASVKGTDMDYTSPKPLGVGFESKEPQLVQLGGFDHTFCVCGRGMRRGGMASDPASGRRLEFFTDMPAAHLYTTVNLKDHTPGKDGAVYEKLDAFCLETENYPGAVNISHFPSPFYKVGELFVTETVYRLSWDG